MQKFKGRLLKRQEVNGTINFDYEASVNKQRVREGKEADFEAQQRKWGEHTGGPVVEHDGKCYLNTKVECVRYIKYWLDGNQIPDDLAEMLVKTGRQESGKQQVEQPVVIRTYDIQKIIQITMNGKTYDLV